MELDTAIINFSKSLVKNGLPTQVTTSNDIDVLMKAFHDELNLLNFWQYYVLNTEEEKVAVKTALSSAPSWHGPDVAYKTVVELANLIRSTGQLDESKKFHARYQVTVKPTVAASLIKAAFVEVTDESALADAWGKVVDVLNVSLYQEWEEDTQVALENIKNRLEYTRLADHGPKLGKITEE